VELFTVSAAELGFQTETASLGQIYARAQQLGFGLAAAEIAPQLRLQYFDQPIGEFLIIGMAPIKTWKGEPVILTVANGGARLILIGQDGRADAEIFVASRFLFVRSNRATPAEAALVDTAWTQSGPQPPAPVCILAAGAWEGRLAALLVSRDVLTKAQMSACGG
jgi:hypothetical protein